MCKRFVAFNSTGPYPNYFSTNTREVTNIKIVYLHKNANSNNYPITSDELWRLYNAAYRIKCNIIVVGSRANGTAKATSDWDYIIEGLNNRKWKKIKNSIPGAKSSDVPMRNIDIVHTRLDTSKPAHP